MDAWELCANEDTPEFVKQVFYDCCEDGQVSFGVCYQLRQAATSEVYRSLIPAEAYTTRPMGTFRLEKCHTTGHGMFESDKHENPLIISPRLIETTVVRST